MTPKRLAEIKARCIPDLIDLIAELERVEAIAGQLAKAASELLAAAPTVAPLRLHALACMNVREALAAWNAYKCKA